VQPLFKWNFGLDRNSVLLLEYLCPPKHT